MENHDEEGLATGTRVNEASSGLLVSKLNVLGAKEPCVTRTDTDLGSSAVGLLLFKERTSSQMAATTPMPIHTLTGIAANKRKMAPIPMTMPSIPDFFSPPCFYAHSWLVC